MAKAVCALLVGINQYQTPVSALQGCLNHIRQIETLLEARVAVAGQPLVLTDVAATRQAMIDGFREHLCCAKAGDVALFYCSRHRPQQKSSPEYWHLEPDRLDDTIVCYGSRQPDNYDLADKQFAQLIAEVAESNAHVAVMLDCCHSGSGTRNANFAAVRRAPTEERIRTFKTFVVSPRTVTRAAERGTGWFTLPQGRHIVLSACRSDEEAKEYSIGGMPRRMFFHFLTETLHQTSAVTYRDLFRSVNAIVRNHAAGCPAFYKAAQSLIGATRPDYPGKPSQLRRL